MSKHDNLITPLSLYIASHQNDFKGNIFKKFFPRKVAYMPEIEKVWENFFDNMENTPLTNFKTTVYDGLCNDLQSRLDDTTGQLNFNDNNAIHVDSFEGCLKCLLHHKDATFFPESRLTDKDYMSYETVKDLTQLCAISRDPKTLFSMAKLLSEGMAKRNDVSHPGSTTPKGEALEFYVRAFFTATVMLPQLNCPIASVYIMCANKSTKGLTDVNFRVGMGKQTSKTSKFGYVPFFLSEYHFKKNTELSLTVTAEADGFQKEERTITVKRGDYADKQKPTITIDLYDKGASPQTSGTQNTGTQNTGTQTTWTQPKQPTGNTPPPPPPPPFPKWIIALIAGVLAAVVGLVLINTCSGNDSPSAILSEQTEDGLPQMPPLDGSSWTVVQMEGQHMPLGTAGAEIHSMDNGGTDLRMGVLNDYGAYREITLTYDRQTGRLLSPELGEGHVEKDERLMKLKIVFEGWLLEKMY